jgi:putative peptide zinc metalloprotease protein
MYTADSRVEVIPFTRQEDGEEIVIGYPETSVFIALPPDAVELLDYLAEGKTIGETQALYRVKYGETPDIADLLEILAEKGFVRSQISNLPASFPGKSQVAPLPPKKVRYHFDRFPQSLARRIFSRNVILGCGVAIGLALLAATVEPSLIPGWNAYFFPENVTLMRLIFISIGYFTLFLHEMAHLLAARAIGVSSRMGISNRMWFLVAETDMTGIWSLPRSQRYLPFLAGPLLDAVSGSVLVLILFAESHGLFELSPLWLQVVRAILLTYLLRLLWQCYLFVRTDFYFAIGNFFGCKSLMKDTEVYLRNQLGRIFHRIRQVDQSHIPVAERKAIQRYAWLWLVGRAAALWSLFFITIPVIWNYSVLIFNIFRAGYQTNPYAFADGLLLLLLILGPQIAGFWLWFRSFRKS